MLTLKSKAPVKFEYRDEDGDGTTVTLDPGDDQETLVRKLKKVLGLASPGPTGVLKSDSPMTFHPSDDAAPDTHPYPRTRLPGATPGNGWAAYAQPEIPERLKGEVELIEEEGA